MNEPTPTIHDVIHTVFGGAFDESTGIRRRRVQQVEQDLRAYIHAEVDRYLTDDERTLLAAEREFAPDGAACRALDAEVLLSAMTGFIAPPYLASDLLLRRAQLNLAEALVGYVAHDLLHGYDTSCIRMDFQWALVKARNILKRERRAQAAERVLARMSVQDREHLERVIGRVADHPSSTGPEIEGRPSTIHPSFE